MKFITDATSFNKAGWYIATATTPRKSLHVLYMQTEEVVCLGVETPPGDMVAGHAVDPILSAIESLIRDGAFKGDYGATPAQAGAFDAIGHLSGGLRRLAKGWATELDLRVTQVFPCFRSELDPTWPSAKFTAAVSNIRDLFDLDRSALPFIEITMEGKAFNRPIAKWTVAPLKTVLSYASALADDPRSILRIRNLRGEVLTLDRSTGWAGHAQVIAAHAQLA